LAAVIVTGIRADNALIFKVLPPASAYILVLTSLVQSAMMPLGITFTTKTGGEYAIVLKTGDDLRQVGGMEVRQYLKCDCI
jgi:hypothetical protein